MRKILFGIGVVIVCGIIFLTTRHSHTAMSSVASPAKLYVALGDSVAAGVGLKDDSDSSACDRTNNSYPNQLATKANYKLVNLACSGASFTEGILGPQDVNELMVNPQLQQLFAQPKPDLITLTIGANDVDWTTLLIKCYRSQCGLPADKIQVISSLATMRGNLDSALAQIEAKYSSATPHVIVTGYHQVFPTSTSAGCPDLTGIDATELAWGRQLQADINSSLQQVVGTYDFAKFAPVDFSGHELCSTDPWVQGLADPQPYHPTQAGQAEFAKAVFNLVKAFN